MFISKSRVAHWFMPTPWDTVPGGACLARCTVTTLPGKLRVIHSQSADWQTRSRKVRAFTAIGYTHNLFLVWDSEKPLRKRDFICISSWRKEISKKKSVIVKQIFFLIARNNSWFFFIAGILLRENSNFNFGYRDRVSQGPSWSEILYVAQIGLGLIVILLPQLPEC